MEKKKEVFCDHCKFYDNDENCMKKMGRNCFAHNENNDCSDYEQSKNIERRGYFCIKCFGFTNRNDNYCPDCGSETREAVLWSPNYGSSLEFIE